MQNDKKNPCHNCPDRHPGCSADCEKPEYLEYKRKEKEKREAIREFNQRNKALDTYTVEQRQKSKRRHR